MHYAYTYIGSSHSHLHLQRQRYIGHRALQWRHIGRDGISNHQPHDYLLNRSFRRRPKKTPKLRVTGLCAGNSPGTGEFLAQMASNAENVSIWWRHYGQRPLLSARTKSISRQFSFLDGRVIKITYQAIVTHYLVAFFEIKDPRMAPIMWKAFPSHYITMYPIHLFQPTVINNAFVMAAGGGSTLKWVKSPQSRSLLVLNCESLKRE